jgi:vacuole morphology and inheritance protein 14
VKDIVSESAATYVSVLQAPEPPVDDTSSTAAASAHPSLSLPTAFSLARFIPLLKERIYVLNPFTRTFLVSWVTLLDTIPDLELVFYLPAFLGGLFKFLSDPNRDVHIATQGALERFLNEIKKISKIKHGIEESKRSGSQIRLKRTSSSQSVSLASSPDKDDDQMDHPDDATNDLANENEDGEDMETNDDDYLPGQDVHVDHPKILDILVEFLDPTSGMATVRSLVSC